MKELKNKEVIAGLILIIILGCIALFLLIKREMDDTPATILTNKGQEKEEILPKDEEEKKEPSLFGNEEVIKEETAVQNKDETAAKEEPDSREQKKDDKKRYNLYTILGDESYKARNMKVRKTEDGQLEELYRYWDSYQLDAVGDIIRLDRIRKIVDELENKDSFYYYGSTDSLGRPSGKGLAVYADHSFYFGSWREGLREGKGMWIQPAIYEEENKNANLGLVEHSYNGDWKKDLPNGEGQEHFSYNYSLLKEDYLSYGFAIANVLGGFRDGYYHGEMYVMTTDEGGKTKDWRGRCDSGSWDIIMEGSTTDAIWQSYEADEQGNYSYHFVFPAENEGYGIHGLMKK